MSIYASIYIYVYILICALIYMPHIIYAFIYTILSVSRTPRFLVSMCHTFMYVYSYMALYVFMYIYSYMPIYIYVSHHLCLYIYGPIDITHTSLVGENMSHVPSRYVLCTFQICTLFMWMCACNCLFMVSM